MTIRTAIFADVQNIYYTTREAYGKQFDYRKLWQRVSGEGDIHLALAYENDRGEAGQLSGPGVRISPRSYVTRIVIRVNRTSIVVIGLSNACNFE